MAATKNRPSVGKISIIDLTKNNNNIIIVETLQIAKNSITSLGVPAIMEFSAFACANSVVFFSNFLKKNNSQNNNLISFIPPLPSWIFLN